MALLFCAKKSGIPIVACHVIHDMRPESETSKDVDCVTKICNSLGIELRVEKVSAAQFQGNSENIYRYLRREKLEAVAKSFETDTEDGISYIATGHHADDQLETLLMKICRGTGLDGLSGIAEKMFEGNQYENAIFVRPMLSVTKKEIYEICKENNIDFVEDSTNKNTDFTRNAIREKVVPILRELFPKCAEHSTSAAKAARSAINLVDEKVDALHRFERMNFDPFQCIIRIEALQVSEDVVIYSWLRRAIARLPSTTKIDKINSTMYNQVIEAIRNRKHKKFIWTEKVTVLVDNFVTVQYADGVGFIAKSNTIEFVDRQSVEKADQSVAD